MNHGYPVVVHAIGWAFVVPRESIVAWVMAGSPRKWYCRLLHRFGWWYVEDLHGLVCAHCVIAHSERPRG